MFGTYSPDEGFAIVLSGIIAALSWLTWYSLLAMTGRQVRRRGDRRLLGVVPIVCMLLLYIVLARWSADDVRTDGGYILFYLILGLAWIGLFRVLLPLCGLSVRDDVLERGNDVAGWVYAGALVGGTICFAGANVGNGPGWWVVLFSGLLSTGSLLVLWWMVSLATGLVEKVTVDRDPAAGLRAAGLFIGAGLVFGRAAAGDWVSAFDTMADFVRVSWPALVLAGAAIAMEHSCVPHTGDGQRAWLVSGWLPGGCYLAVGLAVLLAR